MDQKLCATRLGSMAYCPFLMAVLIESTLFRSKTPSLDAVLGLATTWAAVLNTTVSAPAPARMLASAWAVVAGEGVLAAALAAAALAAVEAAAALLASLFATVAGEFFS